MLSPSYSHHSQVSFLRRPQLADRYAKQGRSLDDATLAMAALYQLGTDDAFKQVIKRAGEWSSKKTASNLSFFQASEMMYKPPLTIGGDVSGDHGDVGRKHFPSARRFAGGCRGIYIYVYFAVAKGEYGSAYDILTDRRWHGAL